MHETLNDLAMALGYQKDGKPSGQETTTRRVGLVASANYAYDNRYLLDLSYRTDGSSQFGRKHRFDDFWSVGVGWNIHHEKFMKDVTFLEQLKIRGSVGKTGANNFSAYDALATYRYYTTDRYGNWLGATQYNLDNPNLTWQHTMKYDIGLEVGLLERRLNIQGDIYYERTNGLVSAIDLPLSNGFENYKANVGKLENKGFELKVTTFLIRDTEKEITWQLVANLVRNDDKIIELSEEMKERNEELAMQGGSTPNQIYREGDSQNSIYAVPSLGIDPTTGQELLLNRNGEVTFTWNAADRVWCGISQPKYRGNLNTTFRWKNLDVNLSFGYHWGGQQYNSTLLTKVEGADKRYNVDKRVFYDRWQKPGDHAFFKDINNEDSGDYTSRFIQDEAVFTCQNIHVSYRLEHAWLKRNLGMQFLELSGSVGEAFRWSTVKEERGTSYPYAHNFSISLGMYFN